MIRGDNSGDSSSFAAKLSPSCTDGGIPYKKPALRNINRTGKKWRLRFLNLNKHAKQISSFHLQSHFCGHGQLKDWQPHFQPTLVKCSISRIIQCFAVVTWNHRRSEYSSTSLGHHNCVTKPSASLHETGSFLQLRRRDGNDATIMQGCQSVLPLSGTSSFW